jgi:hypothetical protein
MALSRNRRSYAIRVAVLRIPCVKGSTSTLRFLIRESAGIGPKQPGTQPFLGQLEGRSRAELQDVRGTENVSGLIQGGTTRTGKDRSLNARTSNAYKSRPRRIAVPVLPDEAVSGAHLRS